MKSKSELKRGANVKLIAPLKNQENEEFFNGTKGNNIAKMPSHKKIRVMLVEDHPMMRKVLTKILAAEDDIKIVAVATDGKDTVTLAQKTSPDVIIIDVNLPRMNGIEATKKIVSSTLAASVIGLSLHDKQEIKDDMREAGATAYILKTEVLETLVDTIRSEAKVKG